MRALALIVLAGCGRIGFDALGDDARQESGSLGDGRLGDDSIVGIRRLAFVSMQVRMANGTTVLDMICMSEAGNQGLQGTYLAAIATASSTIASRFTIDSRDWYTTSGVFLASGAGFFDGSARASGIGFYADGTPQALPLVFWTGATSANAVASSINQNCADWGDTSGVVSGLTGDPVSTDGALVWSGGGTSCDALQPVLCLQE